MTADTLTISEAAVKALIQEYADCFELDFASDPPVITQTTGFNALLNSSGAALYAQIQAEAELATFATTTIATFASKLTADQAAQTPTVQTQYQTMIDFLTVLRKTNGDSFKLVDVLNTLFD